MYLVRETKDIAEWNLHLSACSRVNLLQTWQYGHAKEQSQGWKAIRFLVVGLNRQVIALAQFLVKAFPVLGGVARLNRGPLLKVAGDGTQLPDKVLVEVMAALCKEARRRRWWLVRLAPEFESTPFFEGALHALKCRKLSAEAWASGLFSLEEDENALLMRLSGKWRNCLRKGLRSGVGIQISDKNARDLERLQVCYRELQANKGFSGMAEDLIAVLANQNAQDWQFNLLLAYEGVPDPTQEPVGLLVSIRHADTTTYFIGSTNEQGRKLQANYVLLWHAILHAKRSGCAWFDVGGVNSTTPEGIAHFKLGLQADSYQLVGEWQKLAFLRD